MVGTAIVDFLADNATVTATVGERIYPDLSLTAGFPQIVYTYSGQGNNTYCGNLVRVYDLTLICIDNTPTGAELLGEQVIAALDHVDWETVADEYTTIGVKGCFYQGESLDVLRIEETEQRFSVKNVVFQVLVSVDS